MSRSSPTVGGTILAVNGIVSGYGSTPVLHELSLEAGDGEITVVLGANGVGKTTFLRTVAGLLHTWRGAITLDGDHIHSLGPESRVRLGVGTVPEPPGVFRNLSVLDNLRVGALPLKLARKQLSGRLESVLSSFPALVDRKDQLAGSLSGGEQRMLAIARALMGEPRLLLVDEASMGLSPVMVGKVLALLDDLKSRGLSVCMVEQDLTALAIADRAYVVEQGTVVRTAGRDDLPELQSTAAQVYLGADVSTGRY